MVGFSADSAPRAVFLSLRQAHDVPHHGRHEPEGTVAGGVQENWLIWEMTWYFFYSPLFLEVTCSSCLPEEYTIMDSSSGRRLQEWFLYSALFLVQQRIHVRHQSTRLFGRI